MIDLFDTDSKKDEAVRAFTELLVHPGWSLFVKIKQQNIENIRRLLENADDDHTVEGDDRLRDKLKIHQNDIDLPNKMIKDFTGPDMNGMDPSLDPYDKLPDVKKKS